ncbi:hypothetical protein ACFY36_30060 [Actinoplanes sp. NPDC000266]
MPWAAFSRWMAVIMMAAVLYVVGAADPLDQRPVGAAQSTCASPVALRNGDFESPLIADGSVAAVPLPGWEGGQALLRHDDGQHAELTTGTIHQDVTTTPGQTLHWELRHRGGTLTVLAGSATGHLEQQGDVISGDRAAWATYAGAYTVPEGQTTTRFALRATGPTAIDAVAFGTPACLVTTTTVSKSKAKVKDRLSYVVTTRNAGGNPARSTTITNAPSAIEVGILRPGESHTRTYEVRVAPDNAGTTLRTRTTAEYATTLTGSGDRLTSTSNTVGTEIAPAADLTVDATSEAGPVTTYEITTGNKGPSPAESAQVTAALPDGATAVSATSPGGTCAVTSTTAECSYPTLPPGESRTMTVTAVDSHDDVTVTASSTTDELTPRDNVIGFEPSPADTPPADRPLNLTVTTSTPRVARDGTASFQATVRNDTDAPAAATVRVRPASGLAITAGTPDVGAYSDGTWTVPEIPPGAAAHLDLTATALISGPLSLTVSTEDKEKKATITASHDSTSLAIAVEGPRSPAAAGDTVPFRYRLTNDGTEPLDQIIVTDTLSGPANCPAPTLAPTATMLCDAPSYTVTQDDVDAGAPLTNIVTAEAYATEPLFFGPITADLPIVTAAPSLTVTAEATAYRIRNSGNQTLSDIRLGRALCGVTTLAPGASTTCAPSTSTERVYAYGTAPGAITATAFGPFTLAARPDTTQPDTTQPDTTQPGPAQPGPAQPGPAQPGPAQPGPAQPGPAQPGPAQPGPAQPGPAQPGPAQPGPAQPGPAQPNAGSPGNGSGSAQSDATNSGTTQPNAAGPGATPQNTTARQNAPGPSTAQLGATGLGVTQPPPAGPAVPAPLATTAVPARGALPQLSTPATPDPSVPNPTPTVITPPPAIVPTREQYWADPIPDPVPFSGSPLATASVLGLALLAGGLIVLASLRGRWWPRRPGKS